MSDFLVCLGIFLATVSFCLGTLALAMFNYTEHTPRQRFYLWSFFMVVVIVVESLFV